MPADTDYRVLFYEPMCEYCRMFMTNVARANASLPRDKQISLVDASDDTEPLLDVFQPTGTPELYIDGVVLKGTTTEGYVQGFLSGLLREDFITHPGFNVDLHNELVDETIQEELAAEETNTPKRSFVQKAKKVFG